MGRHLDTRISEATPTCRNGRKQRERPKEVVALKDATAQAQGVRASYLIGTDWLTLPRVALEMALRNFRKEEA